MKNEYFQFVQAAPPIVRVPDYYYIEPFPAPLIVQIPTIIIILNHFSSPQIILIPPVYSALESKVYA